MVATLLTGQTRIDSRMCRSPPLWGFGFILRRLRTVTSNDPIFYSLPASTMDDLHLSRGRYIQQYSSLEQIQVNVFAEAFRRNPDDSVDHFRKDLASFTFKKMVNSRSRGQVLEKWLTGRTPEYTQFIRSLFKECAKVDAFRNHVSHWRPQTRSVKMQNTVKSVVILVDDFLSIPPISIPEIEYEAGRIRLVQSGFSAWYHHIRGEQTDRLSLEALLQIVQRPLPYPPTRDHPLVRNAIIRIPQQPPSLP